MSAPDEIRELRKRYDRRTSNINPDRYSFRRPENYMTIQERQRTFLRLLNAWVPTDFAGKHLVEVGCGTGYNLVEFIRFGFDPKHLSGIELLSERLDEAKKILPCSVSLIEGDAATCNIRTESQDIVFQSVVFSSILCRRSRLQLADSMWRWTRPGGAILWYDFVYKNPFNKDVRAVPIAEVRRLFPHGNFRFHRLTLMPPLARLVVKVSPVMYSCFCRLPALKTHIACIVLKEKTNTNSSTSL